MEKQGIFTISIDFEYALGYADEKLSKEREKLVCEEADISLKILSLLEKYDVSATWAVVGHLLEKDCSVSVEGGVHANFPKHVFWDSDLDWFRHHPKAYDYDDCLWFDTAKVVDAVKKSSVTQDIGSHSYAHILYGSPTIKPEAIAVDIKEIKKIHTQNNLPLDSFIFPRNMEGYHSELKAIGVKCYRGLSKFWYMKLPGQFGRLARLADYYLPTARTVKPSWHKSGLINIPDSLLLLGRNGLRRLVFPFVMKRKIRRGLDQAVKRGEIFHLWFHPSNFSYDTEVQLEIFEYALIEANRLRKQGDLRIASMQTIAKEYSIVKT